MARHMSEPASTTPNSAQQNRPQPSWRPRLLPPVISLLICLCIAGICDSTRRHGLQQELELKAYDWIVRLAARSTEGASPIVIVALDEQDIRQFKQYPVSDQDLATLLQNLLTHH